MRRAIAALFGAGLMFVSTAVFAQAGTAEEIAELRAQVTALMTRLEALEQQPVVALPAPAPAPTPPSAPPSAVASWTDSVRLAGDFRYRNETINDDAAAFRNRQRLRARVNVTSEIAENMTVRFGLSTGGFTNDSGNQTLDDGFSYKDIGADLAYFDWGFADSWHLLAGKQTNPFFRPAGYHLIYDSDLRPEGLAVRYSEGSWFANASAFYAEERGSGPESMLFGVQGGYRGMLDNGIGFTVGASHYNVSHMRGQAPLFTPTNGQGNQLDANGNYLYGFSQVELFGELRLEAGGRPLTLFADLVKNNDADAFDDGYALGVRWRRLASPGDWNVGYAYQDFEANSVVGAFTDSDFAGGTSDGSGHTLSGGYLFPGGWNFAVRYVIGERGEAAGNLRNYNRLMADISLRY